MSLQVLPVGPGIFERKGYLWAMLVGGRVYIRHVKIIPCGFSAAWIVTTEGSEVHSSHCEKDKRQRFAFLIIYGSLLFYYAMLPWIDFLPEMYCNISCPSKHPLSHFCTDEWWHDRSAVCCSGVTAVGHSGVALCASQVHHVIPQRLHEAVTCVAVQKMSVSAILDEIPDGYKPSPPALPFGFSLLPLSSLQTTLWSVLACHPPGIFQLTIIRWFR